MPPTRSGLVLVADLDRTVCMVTVDLLEDEGFRTLTAASTDEVLSTLEGADEVHTLITGRSVRWLSDGIELAHRVHDLWPNIRIIVTSGAGAQRWDEACPSALLSGVQSVTMLPARVTATCPDSASHEDLVDCINYAFFRTFSSK